MSAEQATITAGKVVSIHYTLTNEEGVTIDSSAGREPLDYLHGGSNIVPGLEEELAGQTIGTKLEVVVPPEKGYGPHDARGVQVVPRNSFPPDVDVQAGMQFAAEGPEGQPVRLWVSDVSEEQVTVDINHPLAGVTLHFDVKVEGIRDATAEELEHGHPHGADGHGGHEDHEDHEH